MSAINPQIRELADRVAVSHGLEVVELEFQGGSGKHRTLRVFLERNAAGRAALEVRLHALRESAPAEPVQAHPGAAIELDLVAAGEAAGLSEDEDELGYLRNLPEDVPVAQLSGVTHGDCERFARDFGPALDMEDLVHGAEYTLEASSPGLDRKLTRREEFDRFAGQMCKVQTFTPVGGNRHFQGLLGELQGDMLTLLPKAEKKAARRRKGGAVAAQEPVTIALTNIEKAQLAPEF